MKLEIAPDEPQPRPPPPLSDLEAILVELRNINYGIRSLIRRSRTEAPLLALHRISDAINYLIPRMRAAINLAIDDAADVKMKDILSLTARHFGLSEAAILSPRRFREITRARQTAMFLCKELTPRAYTEIALFFRDRDHTTAMHAVRHIEELKTKDKDIATAIETISKQIKDKHNV